MFWFISDLGFLFFFFLITYICFSFCWNPSFCRLFANLFISSFVLSLCVSSLPGLLPTTQSSMVSSVARLLLSTVKPAAALPPRQHSALLVHIPPAIFFLFFTFVLFYRHFSCSRLWAVIWFSFDLIWDFLPASRSQALSFFFSSFVVVGCRQLMTWSGYLLHFWRQLEL